MWSIISLWSSFLCFSILNGSSKTKMEPIVDCWGRPVQISKFKKMQISFDLCVEKMGSDFTRIPILFFKGNSVRLVFYLNGYGECGIMHHDDQIDVRFEYQQLFGCNLNFVRAEAGVSNQTFQHFCIVVPNEGNVGTQNLFVYINDRYGTDRPIDRKICPNHETMSVWWAKTDSDGNEMIRNLTIRVRDSHPQNKHIGV